MQLFKISQGLGFEVDTLTVLNGQAKNVLTLNTPVLVKPFGGEPVHAENDLLFMQKTLPGYTAHLIRGIYPQKPPQEARTPGTVCQYVSCLADDGKDTQTGFFIIMDERPSYTADSLIPMAPTSPTKAHQSVAA